MNTMYKLDAAYFLGYKIRCCLDSGERHLNLMTTQMRFLFLQNLVVNKKKVSLSFRHDTIISMLELRAPLISFQVLW